MNKFIIKSNFKPTGDQPQAIEKLTQGLNSNYKYQTLLGVTGSGKTFTLASIIEKIQKPALVISHNKTLAAQLASEFRSFFPKNEVHYFVSYYDYYQPEAYIPQTDTYIDKDADINEEIDRLRHAATSALLSQKDVIICASVSCIYNLGSAEEYNKVKITLTAGENHDRDSLLRQLISIQYKRNDVAAVRGTFRVRGDTLEIFPAYSDNKIYRIEFFGDKIENIAWIDYLSGEILDSPKKINIFPATHYVAPLIQKGLALEKIATDLKIRIKELQDQGKELEAQRLMQKTKYDIELIKETGFCKGIENYSRYFDGRDPGDPPYTLIDYFPKDFLLFIDESHMTIPQVRGMYFGDKSRKESLIEYGFRLPSALDNRPLKFNEFEGKINQAVFVSATPGLYELDHSQQIVQQVIRPTGLLDPTIEVKPSENQINDLIANIKKRASKKQRVLVTTLTKQLAEQLTDFLVGEGLQVQYLHSNVDTLERLEILRDLRMGKYDVVVGINLLREGLDLPEVSLIAILDADKEGFLRSETSLIQTIGRAARHKDGHIIMYADEYTNSMKKAIAETKRRRKIQEEYNKKHNITPQTIKKEIASDYISLGAKPEKKIDLKNIEKRSREEIKEIIKNLENQMEIHARNLEFEEAAELRDQIKLLNQKIIKPKK